MVSQSPAKLHIVGEAVDPETGPPPHGDVPAGLRRPVLAFGPFVLDVHDQRLTGPEGPVRLGKKALCVLELLIAAGGRLVTKSDLLEQVWKRTIVSESALTSVIKELRRGLGDTSRNARYIGSVYGSGYRFLAPVETQAAGSARPPSAPPATNVSPPLSRLIGRDKDLAAIARCLASARLVTISGPGGVGKSRLGLEAARSAVGAPFDAVWLVELAGIHHANDVTEAIAGVMGLDLPVERDIASLLAGKAGASRCLLLLDNCEHLVEVLPDLLERLIAAAPQVAFLCTSQAPLGVDGELVYRLQPLAAPFAAELFTERVRSIDCGYGGERDGEIIGAICSRLDGMPLAIEMAAMRVPAFGCAEVLRMLSNRLRLFTNGRRTAAGRHRTLMATLDWTYSLLSPLEAQVFRQLALFPGSFSPKVAADLMAQAAFSREDVLNTIASLVDRSLLVPQDDEGGHRLRMLETMRLYAADGLCKSGEEVAARRNFASYFCHFVEPLWREYCGALLTDGELRHRFLKEKDAVGEAIDWSYGPYGDPEIGHLLVIRSLHLWQGRERRLQSILREAFRRVTAATPEAVHAMLWVAQAVTDMMCRADQAGPSADIAVRRVRAVPGATWPLCYALCAQGFAAWIAGDLPRAREISDEIQAIVPRTCASRGLGLANALEAIVLAREGRIEAAEALTHATGASMDSLGARGLARLWSTMALRYVTAEDRIDEIQRWRDMLSGIGHEDMLSSELRRLVLVNLVTRLARRGERADIDEALGLIRADAELIAQAAEPDLMLMLAELALLCDRPDVASIAVGCAAALPDEGQGPMFFQVDALRQRIANGLEPGSPGDRAANVAGCTPPRLLALFLEATGPASDLPGGPAV